MKTKIIFCLFGVLLISTKTYSQSQIYIGLNQTNASSEAQKLGLEKSLNFNVGYQLPIIQFSGGNIGLNAGYQYINGFNAASSTYAIVLPVSGGNSTIYNNTDQKSSVGNQFNFGPQLNILLGSLQVSPAIDVTYINQKLPNNSVTQNTSYNGTNYNTTLYQQTDTKSKGLGFVPKLKMLYPFKNFGIFAEGNYTMGPKISSNISTFSPNGTPIKDGFYSIDQISSGKTTITTTEIKNNYFSYGIGISYTIGKPKQSQDVDFGQSTKSGVQDHNSSRSNKSASVALDKPDNTDTENQNKIKGNNSMPNRISMTPTTTRQTQEVVSETPNNETETSKTENQNKIKGNNSMPNRISMTPTTTRQIQEVVSENPNNENSKVVEKATSGLKDTLKTQVRTGNSSGNSSNTETTEGVNQNNKSKNKGIGGMSKPTGMTSSSYAAGRAAPNNNSADTKESVYRKGWDETGKGSGKKLNDSNEKRAYNQNASRSNNSRTSQEMKDSIQHPSQKIQNNNTVRSNRSKNATAKPEEDTTKNNKAYNQNASRSNNSRKAPENKSTSKLKTKHDTAKNSINNVR